MESKAMKSTAVDDDDAITTSTESETFGTWTLVTDKNKKQPKLEAADDAVDAASTSCVEELTREEQNVFADEAIEEQTIPTECKIEHDATLDELSDGISIISESESAGRISPHPFLRQQLSDLNLKFTTGDDFDLPMAPNLTQVLPSRAALTLDNDSELRQRRRKRSTSTQSDKSTALQTAQAVEVVSEARFHPILRTGLSGIFYVGALLAVLAFIGKLRYPEWEPLATSKPIVQLEQKLSDMELQNNLMRAEIDLLAKQVNYLSSLNEKGGEKFKPTHDHQNAEKQDFLGKTFKKWAESSSSMDPPKKNNLRKPYKCINGKYVDNADMCIHANPYEEHNYDAFEQADTLNQFMNQAEEKAEAAEDKPKQKENQYKFYPYREETYGKKEHLQEKLNKDFSDSKSKSEQQAGFEQGSNHGMKYKKRRQNSQDQDDDVDEDDDSSERLHKQNSNERYNKQNSKERYNKQSSNERYNKHPKQRNSGENNSKEQREKRHKEHLPNSKEKTGKEHKDGQWHEKLMQHRENSRRNNEKQRNDKNWFIKRGDGREEIRNVDHDNS